MKKVSPTPGYACLLIGGIIGLAGGAYAENMPAPSTPSTTAVVPGGSLPTGAAKVSTVDDGEAGWIWNAMVAVDDSSFEGGTAHAGGPGSYGAYTFHGTGVDVTGMTGPFITVDGRSHKMGRIKFSLDGKSVGALSVSTPDTQYGINLLHVVGLPDGNHVLQLEPEGGWAVIDTIKFGGSNGADTGASTGQSTSTGVAGVADKPGTPGLPNGQYLIALRMDPKKLLSAHDVNPMDGAGVEIDRYTDDRAQVWSVESLDGGLYRISSTNSPDQALSVLPAFLKVGYAIGTWRYTGVKQQQWFLVPTTGGYFRIVPAAEPSNTVDLLWAKDEDGASVIDFGWHGSDSQEWSFRPVR